MPLVSCGGKSKSVETRPADDGVAGVPVTPLADAPEGLDVRLSEGKSGSEQKAPAAIKDSSKPLDAATVSRLLGRLPALSSSAARVAFAFRAKSAPPPRTGATVTDAFAPQLTSQAPPEPTKGTLEVLRHAPDGAVPIAPHVSITFSQPMVAITSHDESIKGGVPAQITPTPEGKWRWLGTKTLMFDPKVRLPMATRYDVRIDTGATSVTGQKLGKPFAFSFTTPAPLIIRSHPQNGPHRRSPVLFIEFDQKIDPTVARSHIRLQAGNKSFGLRAATPEEIKKDATAFAMLQTAEKEEHQGRYVALVPQEPLPAGTTFEVKVPKGMASAEGPLKTDGDQSYTFRTFDPLRVKQARCGWDSNCPPGMAWVIEFNNPLDEEAFQPDSVKIEPALPDTNIEVRDVYMTISGASRGNTRYEVTLPASLRDTFEQTLGQPDKRTFSVGKAEPSVFGPQGMVVLDPAAKKPVYSVHTINVPELSVRIYRVTPAKWFDYLRNTEHNPRVSTNIPGDEVENQTIKPKNQRDQLVETTIDLSRALNRDGLGHAIVIVEPTHWHDQWKPRLFAWVQSTRLGLDGFIDGEAFLAWSTNLADGAPRAGVELELSPEGIKQKSDDKGLARFPLPKSTNMLIARAGDDVAFLPQQTYYWQGQEGWTPRVTRDELRWFVFDDRQMYKPGEVVKLKGLLRVYQPGKNGDVLALNGRVKSVSWRATDSQGNEIGKGNATVNPFGGFHTELKLPATPNLGYAALHLTASGSMAGEHSHNFQIQEFRTPEFEVTTSTEGGPFLVGGGTDVTVKAAYYAGGGLANAPVNWFVNTSPGSFTPPNRDQYTFGMWTPWWRYHRGFVREESGKSISFTGTTSAAGTHVLHLDFMSAKPPRAMNVAASASVTDVNRQTWTATENLLVHPADVYVGLKRDRYFVDKGTPIKLQALVVDHDGKAVAGRKVVVKAFQLSGSWKGDKWIEKREGEQTCELTSTEADLECQFQTPQGGVYQIEAIVFDSRHRPNQTELTTWVTGGDTPPKREIEQEEVTLVPDKKEYAGGDRARILVQSPFFPAEGLLTLRRSGITESRVFHMDKGSTVLEVAIEDKHVPNLWVHVDLVGSAERVDDAGKPAPALPRRPAYAAGELNLAVPPKSRTLSLDVKAKDKAVGPGEKTVVKVTVKDAQQRPVAGTEVALLVVDEAVLSLSNYQTPDPIATFYSQRGSDAEAHHARQWIALARPERNMFGTGGGAPQEEKEGGALRKAKGDARAMSMNMAAAPPPAAAPAPARGQAPAQAPIAVRKDFSAIAAFAPEQKTDANGVATLEVKVPDNLTRYRIMAVAMDKEHAFGSGESNLTARLPVMVRPSPPRFLNFGDKFELPVVVQNQTDKPISVDVAIRADNAALLEGAGRRITIAAQDRVEVRFPAGAEMPGTAHFQVAISAGSFSDAAEFSLPVWTPATTEAFATYGELDGGATHQKVRVPEHVVPTFGGLEITTSSTQLAALTDAFLYLVAYPFECAEQISSRVLAVAALRDVLTEFQASGLPSKAELEAAVKRDIDRLQSLQNDNGGFAFWSQQYEAWPYITVHVTHALVRAKQKGFDVPQAMLTRSMSYLARVENHIPGWYSIEARRTIIAYSLWVRKLNGDVDSVRAKKLLAEAGTSKLPIEALGWLLGTLAEDRGSQNEVEKILSYLGNQVSETAAAANWVTSYSDGAHLILHSDRRADAVILESLMLARPKDDLIPKVVRGLLAHQKRGRWGNTQENTFVLLAMDAYFQRYENVTPDFVARAWLGDKLAEEARFKGRETKRHHLNVPMAMLGAAGSEQNVTVQNDGKGRLYYRLGMTYAPSDLKLGAADHGFAVERSYEPIDDPADVKRNDDGVWHVKAGALVRVRVRMAAENRRYHVALVDPLPAGLEALNPELAVTGPVPPDPKAGADEPYWWWSRPWYEHQNMRDERIEAFASLLWEGVHEYTYVARATTPGSFVVPPAKAEEMYEPETFGRSATDRLIVE